MAICLASGVNAQIHTGVYTHGSVGRNNSGQTITVDKQLLNVEFYSNYIRINGETAEFMQEGVLPATTGSFTFRPGQHVKWYSQVINGMTVVYLVDANYNMEALWLTKQGGTLFYYFFPIEKGNTISSSNSGGYGGNYNSGSYGGYNGSSSSSSSSSSIPRTKCPNCNNGRKVYESTVPYSGTQTRYSTCSECGKRYMSSHTTHRHDRCTTCHGRGYLN